MEQGNNSLYDGIFYRMRQIGKFIAKAPLYIGNNRALESCLEKIKIEFEYLKLHLTIQNIKDWFKIRRTIDEAIERDANGSTNYIIIGKRETTINEHGEKIYKYNHEIRVLPWDI